ncbi:MAG: hypothetical protein ACOZDY_12455 [Pseudomonadota bacterium]
MSTSKQKLPRLLAVGFVVAGVASLGGLGFMITKAIEMVSSGRGLETYHTFWLVEFNWFGFLILLAAIAVALVIGLVLRYREHLLWRSLEKKYGSRKDNA